MKYTIGEYKFVDFEWDYILSNPNAVMYRDLDAVMYRELILSWLIDHDFSTIDLEE